MVVVQQVVVYGDGALGDCMGSVFVLAIRGAVGDCVSSGVGLTAAAASVPGRAFVGVGWMLGVL